ncbi:hypothetical protein ACHAP3_008848 [Botrytis cinerea]
MMLFPKVALFASCAPLILAQTQLNVSSKTTAGELSAVLVNIGFQPVTSLVDAKTTSEQVASNSTSGDVVERGLSSCSLACALLRLTLGDKLSYPGSAGYSFGQTTYWSNFQLETNPTCRVQPGKPVEVSATLMILEFANCKFAVKSGGHAAFTAASNIDGGVTIDMRAFNTLAISSNKETMTVGTGNRWQAVYDYLVPKGYIAVGGRVGDVGVGGYILGGGLGFFQGRYGWACDQVKSFEVVLTSGLVVTASATKNTDLFWALRGGGNNFGIVTNFEINIFAGGDIFAGFYVTAAETSLDVYKSFESFVNTSNNDLDAGFISAASFNNGVLTMASILSHTTNNANAAAFQPLYRIPKLSSSFLGTFPLNVFSVIMNSTGPAGFRESFSAFTIQLDPELQQQCLDIFSTEVKKILDVAGLVPALNFQTITESTAKLMDSNGGNAVGITSRVAGISGRLLVSNLAFMWSNAADDARVFATIKSTRNQCIAASKARGKSDIYVYQNYAAIDNEVFDGYGSENKAKLLAISRKHDPFRFLQTLQPGYFKIGK